MQGVVTLTQAPEPEPEEEEENDSDEVTKDEQVQEPTGCVHSGANSTSYVIIAVALFFWTHNRRRRLSSNLGRPQIS